MFFENDSFSFDIIGVMHLNQENVNMFNSARSFNALSFRYHADTVLKTEKQKCQIGDNYVSFVPAGLDYRRISKSEELIAVNFRMVGYTSGNIECFEAKNPQTVGRLFREISECWNKKEVGYQFRCAAILYEIFAECYVQNHNERVTESKIQPSVDYMNLNFSNGSLTMGEVAKKSFMSEVYFRKLFREEYGISPQKYIVDMRLRHAAGLILSGYYSLLEVAYMSGYNDYKYFSVEFKKAMGVSPSEYAGKVE